MDRATYLTEEAAALLGVKTTTIRQWFREGRIAGTKIGKRILIPVAEIQRLAGMPIIIRTEKE